MPNATTIRDARSVGTRLLDIRVDEQHGLIECARDNVRLAQENETLRQSCADLTRAAETWIRLYESALARANAAEAKLPDRAS
jgi:hypothetical protein